MTKLLSIRVFCNVMTSKCDTQSGCDTLAEVLPITDPTGPAIDRFASGLRARPRPPFPVRALRTAWQQMFSFCDVSLYPAQHVSSLTASAPSGSNASATSQLACRTHTLAWSWLATWWWAGDGACDRLPSSARRRARRRRLPLRLTPSRHLPHLMLLHPNPLHNA